MAAVDNYRYVLLMPLAPTPPRPLPLREEVRKPAKERPPRVRRQEGRVAPR